MRSSAKLPLVSQICAVLIVCSIFQITHFIDHFYANPAFEPIYKAAVFCCICIFFIITNSTPANLAWCCSWKFWNLTLAEWPGCPCVSLLELFNETCQLQQGPRSLLTVTYFSSIRWILLWNLYSPRHMQIPPCVTSMKYGWKKPELNPAFVLWQDNMSLLVWSHLEKPHVFRKNERIIDLNLKPLSCINLEMKYSEDFLSRMVLWGKKKLASNLCSVFHI